MGALNEELLIDGQRMTVGASIGIGQFPDDSTTVEALLLNADTAMYAAKAGGRCAYMRYQDVLEARKREQEQAQPSAGATEGREAEPTA